MTLQEQIRANRLRSVITVTGFFVLIAIVAAAIGLVLDLYIGGFALEQSGGFVLPESLRDDEPFAVELGI